MPFNFDMTEIVVLAVLAVIIFGPEKLPELAKKTGRVLNYVRNIANDAKGQLGKELGPEFENMSLADLNPKALVAKHILDPVQATIEPVKAELAPVAGAFSNPTLTGGTAALTRAPASAAGNSAAASASAGTEPSSPSAPVSSGTPGTAPVLATVGGPVPFDTEAT